MRVRPGSDFVGHGGRVSSPALDLVGKAWHPLGRCGVRYAIQISADDFREDMRDGDVSLFSTLYDAVDVYCTILNPKL